MGCPEPSCRAELGPGLLRRVLSEDLFLRWESLSLQKALEAMPDVTYCPRCEAVCWANSDDGDDSADCPQCHFSFCTLCRNKRHVGSECMTAEERLTILEAGRRAAPARRTNGRR